VVGGVGYQAQERRELGDYEEVGKEQGGYESVSELEEVGEGRGYEERDVEEGVDGKKGGGECGEE
jgi:hypothetical protein